jgi:uncharacterized membrane protein HdeD (DUF308 family)
MGSRRRGRYAFWVPKIKVRPLTIVFLLAAAVLIAAGIYYFVTPAHSLAVFVPGHEAHGTNHHIKHGIAMIGLAVIALIAAWFTTATDRPATGAE